MKNKILKIIELFSLCQRNNSYKINNISVEEPNLNIQVQLDKKL